MRVAVHSHSSTARSGGGVLYVYALAAALAAEHQVEVLYPPTVDLEQIPAVLPPFAHRPRLRHAAERAPSAWLRELAHLARDRRHDGIVIQSLRVPRAVARRRSVLLCEFPISRTLTAAERLRLSTYGKVVANSAYTAGWIARRWGRQATVLEPPVFPIAAGEKRNVILAVGRFMGSGRSKRQRLLVTFFRRLYEQGLRGWELHLAGYPGDRDYVAAVRREALGLPVHLHLDLERPALEALFASASIFWHAVGLGVDPERQPERMEHFGIVTAEAMSAGAVPVVIARGGQPEILGDPPCGALWETPEQCLRATRRLIDDGAARARLAEQARERARRFAFEVFAPRARRLLTP